MCQVIFFPRHPFNLIDTVGDHREIGLKNLEKNVSPDTKLQTFSENYNRFKYLRALLQKKTRKLNSASPNNKNEFTEIGQLKI